MDNLVVNHILNKQQQNRHNSTMQQTLSRLNSSYCTESYTQYINDMSNIIIIYYVQIWLISDGFASPEL